MNPVEDAEVIRLWREFGLPSTCLGDGAFSRNLVAFAKACAHSLIGPAEPLQPNYLRARARSMRALGYDDTARCLDWAAHEIEHLRGGRP